LSSAADGAPPDAAAARSENGPPSAEPRRPTPPPLPAPTPRLRRKAARKRLVREYGEAVLLALVVALAARAVVAETFRIPTASMAPALLAGDHVLVSKLSYGVRLPFAGTWLTRWRDARRGEVVVFEHPQRAGELHVKRVVGVPGDVVELRGQVLHVNGVAQPRERVGAREFEEQSAATGAWWMETCTLWRERLARDPSAREDFKAHDVLQCRDAAPADREGPFEEVRPGHLFVVGDNRDRSDDGRAGGGWQVPADRVVGRAVRVLWSWGPDGARAGAALRFRADRLFKPVE
jgi:signal peptidase I